MAGNYYTTHCMACRATLGEMRQKVTLMREEPYNERRPTWRKWRSGGSYYLCDACADKVRGLLGIEVGE